MVAPGFFLLPAVLSWFWGYDGFVLVDLLCWAELVVVSGGVGLREYGKCIMRVGFGFGIEYFFCFTVTCYRNPFVIIVLSVPRRLRAPSIIS